MDIDDNENRKTIIIFGRDISQIPCMRNSFLYGISGGTAVGLFSFLCTSRIPLSTNIGFGTFFVGTLLYWFPCRYNWSKQKFENQQIEAALKEHLIREGTDLENKNIEEC